MNVGGNHLSIRMLYFSLKLASLCLAAVLPEGAGILLQLHAAEPGTAKYHTIEVRNDVPRRDDAGNVIDAHDGCLQFFEGRYYLYGTAYGKTAGFTINNRFRVYSSADLAHWHFEGELLQEPADGVYYRPYVVYNAHTRKYVLWYNWYPKLWNGQVGIAVSDSPIGPFTIVKTDVELTQAKERIGDGSLFVDDDGAAFFIYTTIKEHSIRIERLTTDYLASSGEVSPVLSKGCEAPSVFRRGSNYYALFDHTCCFCKAGSGARVLMASSPMGPYRETGNVNLGESGKPLIPVQQTWIAKLPSPDGFAYVWMGDQWRSATDGIKGDDLQYWSAPLQFAEDGSIHPLQLRDVWTAKLRTGNKHSTRHSLYVWPQKRDPNPIRVDPCNGAQLNERGEPENAH
jgi:hypothetical protein